MSQQAAEDSLHLCGGNVLPSPTKRVAAAVPEIHVAIFIHYQHVTWETEIERQTETDITIINIIIIIIPGGDHRVGDSSDCSDDDSPVQFDFI